MRHFNIINNANRSFGSNGFIYNLIFVYPVINDKLPFVDVLKRPYKSQKIISIFTLKAWPHSPKPQYETRVFFSNSKSLLGKKFFLNFFKFIYVIFLTMQIVLVRFFIYLLQTFTVIISSEHDFRLHKTKS